MLNPTELRKPTQEESREPNWLYTWLMQSVSFLYSTLLYKGFQLPCNPGSRILDAFQAFPKISFQISKVTIMNNELFSWNTSININQPHRTNKTIASQYCSWKTVNNLPVQQQASGQTIYNTSRPAVWTPLPSEKLLRLSENFYLSRLYICML